MTNIFIISFSIFAIWYCFLEGEIFGKLGAWFFRNLPTWMHSPVYDCPVCMLPYYGSAIYWVSFGYSVKDWLLTIVPAMGLNVVITRLWPKEDITVHNEY